MELLVVLTIIGVLAALILAAVTRGREQAHRTACLSNLRQTHAVLMRFAADNDGALPIGYRLGKKQFNTTIYSGSANMFVLLGRLVPAGLATDPGIFYCPSERDKTQAFNTKENSWEVAPGKNVQGGYASNPLVDWAAGAEPPEWPNLTSQGRIPLLADGFGMPARVDSRHRDGVNVIFSDGGARWVAREKFDADLNGCTSLDATHNAAQDRIWKILAEQP